MFVWPKVVYFFPRLHGNCKYQINLIWAAAMQKFIKYFYFSCTLFFQDLIWHLLSMVMQCFCSEKTLFLIRSFSLSENLGGWGEGVTWGKCGTDMQASISKPAPFIYLTFEKNGPIHVLDRLKCWPIHILPFGFYTHLLLVVRQI